VIQEILACIEPTLEKFVTKSMLVHEMNALLERLEALRNDGVSVNIAGDMPTNFQGDFLELRVVGSLRCH
jgi:hypothetical protein